ncbi:unnamed protein product [Zymoseptoria tritici ST99CH_1E4]|uniref:Uncharacterized protein n=1 Tax=Zymoseptoria tritici ST99CH_1E4 TaxID=1276532 RepID=A0A2H1FY87_ZYMTR|nr:unnamed protein product [Zymoseptoria tritici ST99CH_1E4]
MNETARIESQWDPEVRKRQFKVPWTCEEGDPDPEPWEPPCEAEEPSPKPDVPPPQPKEPPTQPKESPPQSKQSDRPSGGPEPRAKARPKWVWPPRPKKAAAGVLTQAAITKWQSDIELFLSDVARQPFPEAPFEACKNISCQVQDRALDVCDCVIKKLFAGANLKLARNSLHPDRLSSSPAATRKEVQDKGRELFLVVNSMYEQSIGKA